jgi:hypothetical protein
MDAIVEMNQPGAWVPGSVNDDLRTKVLGVVVEYADQKGEPSNSSGKAVKPAIKYT